MSKFCPECGSIIEGLDVCTCGYDVSSGKVNMKIRDKMLEREKELNHMTNDNMINVYVDEIPHIMMELIL